MCMMTLGLRMGLRPSEVENLSIRDIATKSDGTIAVTVREAKTDHLTRASPSTIIEPSESTGSCCPHYWTKRWLQHRRQARLEDPVFTCDGTRSGMRLKRTSVGEILQAVALCVHGESHNFSGKSLRRGMATTMAAAGLSTQQIMAMGRWKTHDMPARYTAEWAPALAGASTILDRSAEVGLMPLGHWRRNAALSRLCGSGVPS